MRSVRRLLLSQQRIQLDEWSATWQHMANRVVMQSCVQYEFCQFDLFELWCHQAGWIF